MSPTKDRDCISRISSSTLTISYSKYIVGCSGLILGGGAMENKGGYAKESLNRKMTGHQGQRTYVYIYNVNVEASH